MAKKKSNTIWWIIGFGVVIIILPQLNMGFFSVILGSNLVQNPSMENSNGWLASGADSSHLLIWDNISNSGSKSLELSVLNSTKSWYNWQGDKINVENNTWYYVEYWYKTEDIPAQDTLVDVYANGPDKSYTNAPARAMMEWSEYDGINPNRYTTRGLTIPWTEGNTGWTKMSAYLKTGVNTTYIYPRFFFYSYSGKVWFDDLVIKKATDVPENITLDDYYWNGIKGVGIHGSHYGDVAGMKELGVTMARDDIAWSSVETAANGKGVYDFSAYDTKVSQLSAVGIIPLFIIDYSNCLYNSMPAGQGYSCDLYVPRNETEFEAFKVAYGNYCYQVVNHFKGKVNYFEVWNEPNGFWQPRLNDALQVSEYVDLMKECYTRAKQANPDSVIVSAGIDGSLLLNQYAPAYYAQGAKDYFDKLGVHPYCDYSSGFPSSEQGTTCSSIENMAKVRNIMVANGDSNKSMWITEFGYPTAGCYKTNSSSIGTITSCEATLSEENQNIRIKNIIPTLREKYPYVTAFFWYDYKDDCALSQNYTECNFGLVRQDLSRKPAYLTYQSLSKQVCSADECNGTTSYLCLNTSLVSQGQVPGKCGVLNPSVEQNITQNTTTTNGGDTENETNLTEESIPIGNPVDNTDYGPIYGIGIAAAVVGAFVFLVKVHIIPW